MKLDSRSDYERCMHRVIAYIDQHLGRPLNLKILADVAHFSRYHFHRLFSARMGETVGGYLPRRRLEVAVVRLAVQPNVSVLDIALSVGFGSGEAFARAFKSKFRCSPRAWRQRELDRRHEKRKINQLESNLNQVGRAVLTDHKYVAKTRVDAPMTVILIDRHAVTIAYLRHLGPYGLPIA